MDNIYKENRADYLHMEFAIITCDKTVHAHNPYMSDTKLYNENFMNP